MNKIYLVLLQFVLFVQVLPAQVKILFDATKAETAGNADWVIDSDVFNLGYPSSNGGAPQVGAGNESNAQRIPTPSVVLGQTYSETYWKGALSYWGLDCVKKGYSVETLPVGGTITYGNASNVQDLTNYRVFIVCEPNIQFTAAEKTAILSFVQNGGGLFMISDHDVSDRNNDGWDSPRIWDDLMQVNSTGNTNPFGMIFNRGVSTAIDNFSQTSTNVNQSLAANDPILHGAMGNVTTIKWSNGTSMTINPVANPGVKAVFYTNAISSPPSGNNQVMVAYASYGNGKVMAIGDSSPCDDGTGDPNDNLFTGYMGDVPPNHRNLLMNGTIWLVTPSGGPVPLSLVKFTAGLQDQSISLYWQTENEQNVSGYQVQRSSDGIHFENTGGFFAAANISSDQFYQFKDDAPLLGNTENYYRLKMIDNDGSFKFSEVRVIHFKNTFIITSLVKNPVQNEIQLTINSTTNTNLQYIITSLEGQNLLSKTLHVNKGMQLVNIDAGKFSSGLYQLTLKNDLYTKTFRFIKFE